MQHRSRSEEEKREASEEEVAHRVCMDYGYMSKADEEEGKDPMLVMVDETTGDRFARLARQKGLGENREAMWLVKDASEELRAWGQPGWDGEPAHPEVRW